MGKIREGELYKRLELFGRAFELYYGYYEDYERERGEPVPIYPDFQKSPEYTPDTTLVFAIDIDIFVFNVLFS